MIVTAALQRARAHPALGPALAAVAEELQEMRVAADDDETEGEAGHVGLVEGWLRVAERYQRECDRCAQSIWIHQLRTQNHTGDTVVS
jgi:hypothetical protein